jgi:anti-sigma B factor antagonist
MHVRPTLTSMNFEGDMTFDSSRGVPPTQGIYRLVRPVAHVVVVELLGEHDLETATHLREVLLSLIESHELVVLDLTAAEFVDSSVMLTIVQAHRLAGETGTDFRLVVDDAARVHRVLEISRVLEHCNVDETRELALAGHAG